MSNSDEDKKGKKMKRMCIYKKEWEQKYDFIKKDNSSCYKSYCNLCKNHLVFLMVELMMLKSIVWIRASEM